MTQFQPTFTNTHISVPFLSEVRKVPQGDYYRADKVLPLLKQWPVLYEAAKAGHEQAFAEAQNAADEIERLRAEVAGLRECAIDLWMMLDDIDTGGDRAKADDVLYRAIAERTHRRRFSPKYQVVIDAIDAALAARKGEA